MIGAFIDLEHLQGLTAVWAIAASSTHLAVMFQDSKIKVYKIYYGS